MADEFPYHIVHNQRVIAKFRNRKQAVAYATFISDYTLCPHTWLTVSVVNHQQGTSYMFANGRVL